MRARTVSSKTGSKEIYLSLLFPKVLIFLNIFKIIFISNFYDLFVFNENAQRNKLKLCENQGLSSRFSFADLPTKA